MARPEDLVSYKKRREAWEPFTPLLSSYIVKVTFSKQVECVLTGDIFDNYEDCKFRKVNELHSIRLHEKYDETMRSPEFGELLASQTIPLRVKSSFWFPRGYVRTKHSVEPRMMLILEGLNGEDLTNNEKGLTFNKLLTEESIGDFSEDQSWFKRHFDGKIEIGEMGPFGQRLSVQLSHREWLTDQLAIGVHFNVCATFCKLLEPLTYFFHGIMTETVVDVNYGRQKMWDFSDWVSIEYTALLTIFFLQQCRLIPLLMRYTDELLPANLTLSRIKEWSQGLQFFNKEYYRKKYEIQQKSFYSSLSVGTLFVLMLNFYTKTCPLDKVKIHFDKGTYSKLRTKKAENDTLIETILFRKNDCTFMPTFPKKTLYTNVMRKMLEFITAPETYELGVTVQLVEIRRNLEEEEEEN